MTILRICLAQLNMAVGDLEGNVRKTIKAIKQAEEKKADIICFPELAITGYPPEDLLLRPKFVEDNLKALDQVVQSTGNILTIVGFVDRKRYLPAGRHSLYNAAAVINNQKIITIYHKNCLPNYGVFDEKRYFAAGRAIALLNVKRVPVGISICEDICSIRGPAIRLAKAGAKLIININSSPYHKGKGRDREKLLSYQASQKKLAIVYNNLVGGQDELVFDGGGLIVDNKGTLIASLPQFKETLTFVDLELEQSAKGHEKEKVEFQPILTPFLGEEEEVYTALGLGLSDYINKNNFQKVLVGISGGIDSALTTAIAVDALGAKKVATVFMPSRYTSKESLEDAYRLTKNLKVEMLTIPIDAIFESYLTSLKEPFKGTALGVAEENIQARIRGNILMALSNKFNYIVLATGNKSELSVGYATLYGDMAGGFSVLKDVPKTLVYRLAKYHNSLEKVEPHGQARGTTSLYNAGRNPAPSRLGGAGARVIPERILTKPPSAELKPGQLDTDVLPPYEILDSILKAYIEEDRSPDEIIKLGFDKKLVNRVVEMVDHNEYKRRQAAPGIKITPKAFGKDRRMPITNRYGDS